MGAEEEEMLLQACFEEKKYLSCFFQKYILMFIILISASISNIYNYKREC